MKSILLIVEFKYPLEQCEEQITAILDKLPGGTGKVMHGERSIGFLIPPVNPVLAAVIARARAAPLKRVANWRAFGLSGDTLCQDGSMDPVEDWMGQYRLPPPHRQRPRP